MKENWNQTLFWQRGLKCSSDPEYKNTPNVVYTLANAALPWNFESEEGIHLFIPCQRKYSQSETRKATAISALCNG